MPEWNIYAAQMFNYMSAQRGKCSGIKDGDNMTGHKFVEWDKTAQQIVVTLPINSSELRDTIMQKLAEYAYNHSFNESTIKEMDNIVTNMLLENSHPVD